MATWEIMIGFEALSVAISLGAILAFMFKKDPAEEPSVTVAKPVIPDVQSSLTVQLNG